MNDEIDPGETPTQEAAAETAAIVQAVAEIVGEVAEKPVPPANKYECKRCKAKTPYKWEAPCPFCGLFVSCVKMKGAGDEQKRTLATAADAKPLKRISTGFPDLDKMLGGSREPEEGFGLRPAEVILFAGPRGCGKSTLTLQMLDNICKDSFKGVYACGEMNEEDVREFARRFSIKNQNVTVLGNACDVYKWMEDVEDLKPKILVVDSIQTSFMSDVEADVGQVAQNDAVMQYLSSFAKEKKVIVIFLGHCTSTGEVAGGAKIGHLCDLIMRIDRRPELDEDGSLIEDTKNVRELSIEGKNRWGRDDLTALLEMTDEGLKPLSTRKSKLYLVTD